MGIVIFVIFLLSDLITVLICGFSYGKKYEYREGMVFGVHIPEEALKTEEVAGIIRKNKKNRKIFQIVNFVVSVGICFICFADFILFMIVWTVWITEYVAGVMYLIWHPNRRLYRIKIKNGWVRDSGRRIVRVDTGVSARSYRMALSLKYHIPSFVILMLCLLIIYLSDMSFGGEDMAGIVMIIASAAEFLCFFMIHIFVIRRPNIVHSQNSSVNYAANMLSKRGWSTGLIVSGYFCTASALYLIGRAAYMGWLNEFDFLIYMLFQLMTAVSLAIPVFRGSRKRQEILASDGEAFEVDDDEYLEKRMVQ